MPGMPAVLLDQVADEPAQAGVLAVRAADVHELVEATVGQGRAEASAGPHDGTVAQGDAWLASHLPAILDSSAYRAGNTAIFITWDEGSGGHPVENCAAKTSDTSCHIATIVVSPSTRAGTFSGTLFNHYSLLGTAEQLLGLPRLGQASSYPTMTAAFHL